MKKRLLFAVLLSAAAGGMLYQVSWSQDPVDAPGQSVSPPEPCHPDDQFCVLPILPPVDAPGQEIEVPVGCPANDPFCQKALVPPPVDAPGQEVEIP